MVLRFLKVRISNLEKRKHSEADSFMMIRLRHVRVALCCSLGEGQSERRLMALWTKKTFFKKTGRERGKMEESEGR